MARSRMSPGSKHGCLPKEFVGVKKGYHALTLFVILLILWVLGLLSGFTLGGVIHALLVFAIIVVVIQVVQGRRGCDAPMQCVSGGH